MQLGLLVFALGFALVGVASLVGSAAQDLLIGVSFHCFNIIVSN